MSRPTTESKRLLSHTIAEWACSLKYEDLSPEAIQAAKLFWFDSIGCALGGSQQEDAKILLKHYQPPPASNARSDRQAASVSEVLTEVAPKASAKTFIRESTFRTNGNPRTVSP